MKNMGYKVSPSSLNLMLDCPRCFWLQLVKKERRPPMPFPSLPSSPCLPSGGQFLQVAISQGNIFWSPSLAIC